MPGGSGGRAGRAAGAPTSWGCHLGGCACLGGGSPRPAGSPPGTHPDCHNQSLSEQIMCLIYYTCPPDPASEFILIYGAPSRGSFSVHLSYVAAGLSCLALASSPPTSLPFFRLAVCLFKTVLAFQSSLGVALADLIIHFPTATSFASFPIQHPLPPLPRPLRETSTNM